LEWDDQYRLGWSLGLTVDNRTALQVASSLEPTCGKLEEERGTWWRTASCHEPKLS